MFLSRFARYCTSRFSISCRTASSELKIVGTTTNVRAESGIPLEVSIFGGVLGRNRKVTSRFNELNARSLAGTSKSRAMSINNNGVAPQTKAYRRNGEIIEAVSTPTAPRYTPVG